MSRYTLSLPMQHSDQLHVLFVPFTEQYLGCSDCVPTSFSYGSNAVDAVNIYALYARPSCAQPQE